MDPYKVRNQADIDENENLGSDTDEDEQLTEDKGCDTQQEQVQVQERVFPSKSFHNPPASTNSTPWSIEKNEETVNLSENGCSCGRGFSSISSDLLIVEGTGWPEAVVSCHESLVWY